MDGIWTLPGPARFAKTARDRLGRGDSVLVGLPTTTCEDGDFAAGLRQAVGVTFDIIIDATGPEDRPIASVVAEKLGADIEPGSDAAVRLANDPALENLYIAFTVTGKPADTRPWTDFFRAFLAAARPIATEDRPRLFIVAGHGPATALAGADPLAELWWWGVLDRFDTALHVQQCLASREDGDLLRDAITEVAGYDLGLASYLADEWTGDAASLAAVLGDYTGPEWPSILVPGQLPHTSTPWEAPPGQAVTLWNAGLADAWDSFGLFLHPCSLSAQEQRQRIWRGQIRCLMPLIDEERARLEEWIRGEIRGLPKERIFEAGDLYGLLQDNPRLKNWRGGHRKRLIYWLRDTRNALAHMMPLSPADVAEGRRMIWRDRNLAG
jgi:hypothetical protein